MISTIMELQNRPVKMESIVKTQTIVEETTIWLKFCLQEKEKRFNLVRTKKPTEKEVWWAKKHETCQLVQNTEPNSFWMTSSSRWFTFFSKLCQNYVNQKCVDMFKVHLWSDSCVEKQEKKKHCAARQN